jgi:ribosomal 30S subunit maturation factor RimM
MRTLSGESSETGHTIEDEQQTCSASRDACSHSAAQERTKKKQRAPHKSDWLQREQVKIERKEDLLISNQVESERQASEIADGTICVTRASHLDGAERDDYDWRPSAL